MPQAESDDVVRSRHTSGGLLIVLGALAVMITSLVTMSIGGSRSLGVPNQFGDTTALFGPALFWMATVASLAGKLKIRLDHRRSPENRFLDWSIAAGLVPLVVLALLRAMPNPGPVYVGATAGVPISFLFFVRFLRGWCERLGRTELAARAGRLQRFATGVFLVALAGLGMLWLDALLGALFILAAYVAGGVAALWYASLLAALRRSM